MPTLSKILGCSFVVYFRKLKSICIHIIHTYTLYLLLFFVSYFIIYSLIYSTLNLISIIKNIVPNICGLNTQSVKYLILINYELGLRQVTSAGNKKDLVYICMRWLL